MRKAPDAPKGSGLDTKGKTSERTLESINHLHLESTNLQNSNCRENPAHSISVYPDLAMGLCRLLLRHVTPRHLVRANSGSVSLIKDRKSIARGLGVDCNSLVVNRDTH